MELDMVATQYVINNIIHLYFRNNLSQYHGID